MTLIRGGANGRGGLSSLAPNTTIFGEESLIENGEIEELHYLSVKVERMKKAMLNRVEGLSQSELKAGGSFAKQQQAKNLIMDENERREEMLYRSMDNLIDTQTGGGDILQASKASQLANGKQKMSEQELSRRNSELNSYAQIAISDQKDLYDGYTGRQGRVTNLDI